MTLYETREGDSTPFEGVDVRVLGPPDPYIESEARNENSILLKLVRGDAIFLLTGDAEGDQEAYLVDNYGAELRSTVLTAGHHGPSTSTNSPLLDAAQPKAVVISSAYDSQYGHPHEEVLHRLTERSIEAYWTATYGDTVLVSDGSGVSVRTQAAAPTAPLERRKSEAVEPGTSRCGRAPLIHSPMSDGTIWGCPLGRCRYIAVGTRHAALSTSPRGRAAFARGRPGRANDSLLRQELAGLEPGLATVEDKTNGTTVRAATQAPIELYAILNTGGTLPTG